MADTRRCEHCEVGFTPRREHSRFCSAECRRAWNKEHVGSSSVSSAALDWSLSAMTEATGRLARARTSDPRHAAVAVSDAVWWITIVDATLVRYHADSYDATLDAQPADRRAEIEQTLAGLRFVRNQMGVHLDPAEFIGVLPQQPGAPARVGPAPAGEQSRGLGRGRHALGLAWNSVPPPVTDELSLSGQAWEHGRYRAYQERLAGQDVARTLNLAARFLRAAAEAASAWTTQEAAPPAPPDAATPAL